MSVHVIPNNDERTHARDNNCWCDPRILWIDEEDGIPFRNGPLVIHNAADCRETSEEVTGEISDVGKNWIVEQQ